MIPPGDRRRRRDVLRVGVLNVDLLVLVLVLIVVYSVRRSRTRTTSAGSMSLLVRGTGRSRESGRVLAHQLADHPEGAWFLLRLLRCRFEPVDSLGSVDIRVPGRGVGDDRAKRATFAAHAGDGAAGRTLADFHSGRSGMLLRRLLLRRWRWRRWWRAL